MDVRVQIECKDEFNQETLGVSCTKYMANDVFDGNYTQMEFLMEHVVRAVISVGFSEESFIDCIKEQYDLVESSLKGE